MYGKHCIRSWSSTQRVVALSSGEAEYYAMLKGCSVALGVRSCSSEWGLGLEVELRTDSSAGKGVAQRRGLGKLKHLHTCYLWLQERVARGEVTVVKVGTKGNWADVFTEWVDRGRMDGMTDMMGERAEEGRNEATPKVPKNSG